MGCWEVGRCATSFGKREIHSETIHFDTLDMVHILAVALLVGVVACLSACTVVQRSRVTAYSHKFDKTPMQISQTPVDVPCVMKWA